MLMLFLGLFMVYICSIGGGTVLIASPLNPIVYVFMLIFGLYLFTPVLAEVKDTRKKYATLNPPPVNTSCWQDLKNLYSHRNDDKKYQELSQQIMKKRRRLINKKREIENNPNSSLEDKYNIQQQIWEFDKLYQIGKFRKSMTKEEKQEIYQSFKLCQDKQTYWFHNYPMKPTDVMAINKPYMFWVTKQNEMSKVYGRCFDYET